MHDVVKFHKFIKISYLNKKVSKFYLRRRKSLTFVLICISTASNNYLMYNRFILEVSLVLLSVLTLSSCSSPQADTIPTTDNEVFNRLLRSEALRETIHLDLADVDTIVIGEEQVLGKELASDISDPLFLEFPTTSIAKLDHRLFVIGRNKIYAIDRDGVVRKVVGREGKGPTEFSSILKIDANSEYLYVLDYGNGRIQQLDAEMNLTSVTQKALYVSTLRKNFTVSDTHLYIGLRPPGNSHLVSVYETEDLQNPIGTFWPKIIPDGMQPGPFNAVMMDVNNDGRLAITNSGLPYLFILNADHEVERILYFDSAYYRNFDNPSANPVHTVGNSEATVPGVRIFIHTIRMMDDGSIYFTVKNTLYLLKKQNNSYRLKQGWFFMHQDPILSELDPNGIDISGFVIDDEAIFFLSRMGGYVYKAMLD